MNRCKSDSGCELCNEYRLDYLACQNFRSNGFFDSTGKPQKTLIFVGNIDNNSIGAYPDAQSHQICPKSFPICSFLVDNNNTPVFGCIDDNVTIECGDGENTNVIKCGNDCVDISLDPKNCGGCGMECKGDENSHAHEFSCENRTCIPKSCKTGFHLSDGKCVEDSADACGPGVIDCTQIQGWKESKCENGVCVASECYENFHLNDKVCEVDSVMSCGVDMKVCQKEEGDGVKSFACVNGECIVISCKSGFHKDPEDKRCEADSTSACGSWNYSCDLIQGWRTGNCADGQCVVEECGEGYHNSTRGACDPDTNSACGSNGTDCGALGQICSGGNCVSDCQNDEKKCPDGCFDIKKNVNHCGDCSKKCNFDDSMETKCENSFCQYQCKKGYGNCDNDWNNGCETELNKYNLIDNNDGTCSCVASCVNCGQTITDSQVEVPLCIDSLDKYHLDNAGGRCSCKNPYSQCGSTRSLNGKKIPLCIQNASNYHLVSHGNDACGCEDSYTQCGTRKLSDGTYAPACIRNEQFIQTDAVNGLERKSDGTCGCIDGYLACGTGDLSINDGEWFTTNGVPICIRNASDYGLVENSEGKCVCESQYTACGTINADIGYNNTGVRVPLCLKQGDFYTNYSTNGSDSNQFRHNAKQNNVDVYYDYKVSQCQLAVSYWYDNYRYLGNKQYGWQGKDKWSSETCAILCNSQEQIRNSNPKEGISNENVNVIFAHRCNPKSVCHQSAEFDGQSSNGFYYNYGCKDGPDGYYKQKNCNE